MKSNPSISMFLGSETEAPYLLVCGLRLDGTEVAVTKAFDLLVALRDERDRLAKVVMAAERQVEDAAMLLTSVESARLAAMHEEES